MARKSFRNLKELEKYVKDTIPNQIMKDGKVESLLKTSMRQAVQEVVYDVYLPEHYKRRGANGGLLDMNAMQITDVLMDGKNFKMIFENLAQGNDNDTLSGDFLTDTIEEGLEHNWQKTGVWSQPRPFVATTMGRIKSNPKPLIDAIKSSFIKAGFKVK